MLDLAHDPCRYIDLKPPRLVDHVSGRVKILQHVRLNCQPMLFPLGLPPDDVRGGKPTTSADLEAVAPLFYPHTPSLGP